MPRPLQHKRPKRMRRLQWAEEQRQEAIEEDKRRWQDAGETSRKELLQVIERWGEQKRIEAFFAEAALAVKQQLEVEQPHLLERIALAQKMIGVADALQEIKSWRAPAERYELLKKRTYW